jgi:hypothetical protein
MDLATQREEMLREKKGQPLFICLQNSLSGLLLTVLGEDLEILLSP